MSLLELNDLTVRFGGLTAVNKVDFSVERGAIVSVIGPNGAGKTTIFNAITGVYEPNSGTICFCQNEICRPFSKWTGLGIFLVGAATALGSLVILNLDSLWNVVITSNYVYQQPFAWGAAIKAGFEYLINLSPWWNLGPLFFGGLIGAIGAFTVWQRARRSPEVVADCGGR